MRYALITRADIERGRERRAATPHQARHFLDAMRALFRWAHKVRHIKHDPTAGVENPARPKNEGFKPWNEEDVCSYEQRWPLGTRQRVWLDVLLYTGLRRGDSTRLGRQHVRHGTATLTTEKTGTVVSLPILPVLQRTLDAGRVVTSPILSALKDGRLQRRLSATSFGMPHARPASASQPTACVRLRLRDAPKMARRCRR